jgi:hypothetical protein
MSSVSLNLCTPSLNGNHQKTSKMIEKSTQASALAQILSGDGFLTQHPKWVIHEAICMQANLIDQLHSLIDPVAKRSPQPTKQ